MSTMAPERRRRFDWTKVGALVRKDATASIRSKAVFLPMILVPVFILLLIPAGLALYARTQDTPDLGNLVSRMPDGISEQLAGLNPQQQLITLVLGFLVAPLFLIVPLMMSAVLAADSFAGEKERKTLESLLHLPVTDTELFVAKVVFAFIPSVMISWIGFLLFAFIVNGIAWPVMERVFVPDGKWLLIIFWVAPAVAALGLSIMVRVSARSNTTQEASQLGGAVILPLLLFVVGQATSLMLLAPQLIVSAGFVAWIVALILIRGGMKRFTRDQIATRL